MPRLLVVRLFTMLTLAAGWFAASGLPAHAADPAKTLRVSFAIAETSFDPAFASDAASDAVIANIMESMLDYDFLARPVKLVPRTLEAMPTVEDNGKTYICRIRKGIFFAQDPACFNLTEFNRLYDAARALPDSPERTKLFGAMTELVVAYAPWRLTLHLLEDSVAHPWVRQHKPHPIRSQTWLYVDVEGGRTSK